MLGIADYTWRLIPANPILLRVVAAGGKRRRDLAVRCGYLGLLICVVLFALVTSGDSISGAKLGELAKVSGTIFQHMSYLQLALVALLAPIFTAGAITQEKDSQTYDILLSTPLTNGQIVLGSLLSRLFFIIALLVSGIPIFSITQIFGGVGIADIALSFAIASATAFFTGALAMAIATFKVGTRRTIFSFYLLIAIFVVGGYLLDQVGYFRIQLVGGAQAKTTWLTGLHPFLALRTIFGDRSYTPPQWSELPPSLQGWPIRWYLTRPDTFYVSLMFLLSLLLVLPSVLLLRRLAQSTASLRTAILRKLRLGGDRRRKPRNVWNNPIAWREAKTKASAARASFLRWSFIGAGLFGAAIMVWMFAHEEPAALYITPASYNARDGTLAVLNTDKADTFLVGPQTAVTYNGKEASLAALRGRRQVAGPLPQSGTFLAAITVSDVQRQLSEETARSLLLGLVIVEFAVILLIVTNAAASTVTREKEDGTLDLLLATPITSRYYIWGKLRGLVSFVLPLIAVPVLSALFFVTYDFSRLITGDDSNFRWIVFPEALLLMPATLIIVAALASILGMQLSLRCRTTVRTVMSSIGIVVGECQALGWCGFQMLGTTRAENWIVVVFGAVSPFTVITVLIDPYHCGGQVFSNGRPEDVLAARVAMFIASWAATVGYGMAVWWMYKSMVYNFDMTIRKQSQ